MKWKVKRVIIISDLTGSNRALLQQKKFLSYEMEGEEKF